MSEKHEVKLGQILIGDEHFRDAVHIAVAPVIAGVNLNPRDHIALENGRAYPWGDLIGIVDPFLRKTIYMGEQFYMFLYPNTITSLRHEWTHPAFENNDPIPSPSYDEDDDYSCPC